MTILGGLPPNINAGYKGKIRQLLTPYLEDIKLFDMKKFVSELKNYEDTHRLFDHIGKNAAHARASRK